MVRKTEKPKGRHVFVSRTRLGFSQTQYATLLEASQSKVSDLENAPDLELEGVIRDRFLRIEELLPTRPSGGFNEAVRILAEAGALSPRNPAPLHPRVEAAIDIFIQLAQLLIDWLKARQSTGAQDKDQGGVPLVPERPHRSAPLGWTAFGLLLAAFVLIAGVALLKSGFRITIQAEWPTSPALQNATVEAGKSGNSDSLPGTEESSRVAAAPNSPQRESPMPAPLIPNLPDGGVVQRNTPQFWESPDWDVDLFAQSIPERPSPKAKKPPCLLPPMGPEIEINSACYIEVAFKPPCPPGTLQHGNKCYLAVGARTPTPNSEDKGKELPKRPPAQ